MDVYVYSSCSSVYQNKPKVISKFLHENKKKCPHSVLTEFTFWHSSFQQNKSDVKSIMARFQAGGASTDETSSTPVGRTKQPLHSTFSSGPAIQTKKPVLESLSGSAINVPPKPNFLKSTVSTRSDTEATEPNKTKALASRFSNTQDSTNTNGKPVKPLKPTLSQTPEAKDLGHKPALNKPPLSSTFSDTKPAFPKPSPVGISKPSWVKEDGGGESGSTPPKIPSIQSKPPSSMLKLRQQNQEVAPAGMDVANKPPPPGNSTPKPQPSSFQMAQNMFNKESDRTEQSDSVRAEGAGRPPVDATNSTQPPKPPASKKPSIRKPSPHAGSVHTEATPGPKRNPLPNSYALGPAPAKPNRPPKVNLEAFKRGAEPCDDGKSDVDYLV